MTKGYIIILSCIILISLQPNTIIGENENPQYDINGSKIVVASDTVKHGLVLVNGNMMYSEVRESRSLVTKVLNLNNNSNMTLFEGYIDFGMFIHDDHYVYARTSKGYAIINLTNGFPEVKSKIIQGRRCDFRALDGIFSYTTGIGYNTSNMTYQHFIYDSSFFELSSFIDKSSYYYPFDSRLWIYRREGNQDDILIKTYSNISTIRNTTLFQRNPSCGDIDIRNNIVILLCGRTIENNGDHKLVEVTRRFYDIETEEELGNVTYNYFFPLGGPYDSYLRDGQSRYLRNGNLFVYSSYNNGSRDVFLYNLTNGVSYRLTATLINETFPSTDGRWVVWLEEQDKKKNDSTITYIRMLDLFLDTDDDGVPNYIDTDDDNDGYSDLVELEKNTNYLNKESHPGDTNGNEDPWKKIYTTVDSPICFVVLLLIVMIFILILFKRLKR